MTLVCVCVWVGGGVVGGWTVEGDGGEGGRGGGIYTAFAGVHVCMRAPYVKVTVGKDDNVSGGLRWREQHRQFVAPLPGPHACANVPQLSPPLPTAVFFPEGNSVMAAMAYLHPLNSAC